MAASSYYSTVQKAYIAFYGRPADPSGLTYWATRIDAAGGSISSIIQAFGTSAEATSLYGSLSNTAAVNALYQQIFGRDADITGLNYYVGKLLDGSFTLVDIAQRVIDGATGNDATIVTNKLAAAQTFTDHLDQASEVISYAGTAAADAARSWLAGVDGTTASVTAAQGSVDNVITNLATAVNGQTLVLTTSADAYTGTTANDLFQAGVGRLNSSDAIYGGLGKDTLSAQVVSAVSDGLIVDGVETIILDSRDSSASVSLAYATGYTAVVVEGNGNIVLSGVGNSTGAAPFNIEIGAGYAKKATFNSTNTALNITVHSGATAGLAIVAQSADLINLKADGNVTLTNTATNFSAASALNITGSGNVDLNLGNLTTSGGTAGDMALTAVNATALTGNLTLNFAQAQDVSVRAGAGNDVIQATANYDQNDTIDAGAGTDTVSISLKGSNGYVRPVLAGVENLWLQVASANTADLSAVDTTLTALTLQVSASVNLVNAQTSLNSITIASAGGSALDVSGTEIASGGAYNLALNLANASASFTGASAGPADSGNTTTAISVGDLTFTANTGGAFTLNVTSTANYSADVISIAKFSAITINTLNANLVAGASGTDLGTATNVVINATKALTLTDVSAIADTTFDINTLSSAGVVNIGSANLRTAQLVTIDAADAFSGDAAVTIGSLTFRPCAGTAVLGPLGINITAGGDVTITSASFNTATAANTGTNITFSATLHNTATVVNFAEVKLSDLNSAGSAGDTNVVVKAAGTGSFVYSATAGSANLTIHVDVSGMTGTGSNVTLDFSGVADTDTVVSAILGATTGTYVGAAGVDQITFGAGQVYAEGGKGNDKYYLSAAGTANSVVVVSALATADQGVDTVYGANAGDVIFLAGASTAATTGNCAIQTGTATTATQFTSEASLTAYAGTGLYSANQHLAVYTSNGDTIIAFLRNETAGTAGEFTAKADTAAGMRKIVIANKDFTAVTAAFRLDTNGSGILITLL